MPVAVAQEEEVIEEIIVTARLSPLLRKRRLSRKLL
jgi:hypothetical protein